MKDLKIMGVALSLALLIACTGCGKNKPGTPGAHPSPSASPSPKAQKYVNDEVGYTVTRIPEGWVTPVGSGFAEFFVEFVKATFEPKPTFNIVSSKVALFDVHDPARQREIKEEIDSDLKTAKEENILVDGKPAYQIIYGAELKGSENRGLSLMIKQTYFFYKNHLIVATGGCREDKYGIFEPDFDTMLSSMTFK